MFKHRLKHIYILVFSLVAFIILAMMNADFLYALQENSLFVPGNTFMTEIVSHRGGVWAWLGSYFTQFFYHPWIGATILILFWIVTYYCIVYIFRIKDKWTFIALIIPTILLYNILSIGYWIYYIKTPGYTFTPTIGLFTITSVSAIVKFITARILHYCKRDNNKLLSQVVSLAVIVLLTLILSPQFKVYSWTMPDKRFYSELRMCRAINEERYDDVISEIETTDSPTDLMVMYKNIALIHSDKITDMFVTGNCGTPIDSLDGRKINLAQVAGPEIYYQMGQINYAYRWAMENSVKYGFTVARLKIMIKCAILNQEFDLAHKYLSILKPTLYHHDWAVQHEQWIFNSTTLFQSNEYNHIIPLVNDDINYLDTDEGNPEKWLQQHFSDLVIATSPKMQDVILCYALSMKDGYSFCLQFYDYYQKHSNEQIPNLYQEGLVMIGKSEESPLTLDNFPFDRTILTNYNSFLSDYNKMKNERMNDDDIAEKLKPAYGKTYWWYYLFFWNDIVHK